MLHSKPGGLSGECQKVSLEANPVSTVAGICYRPAKGHIEVPVERVAAVKGKLQSIYQLSLVPAKMWLVWWGA